MKTLEQIWRYLCLATKISYWILSSSLKWLWQALPKTELDVYRFILLLIINYFVGVYVFIPATSAYFDPLLTQNERIIVEKEIVEIEVEPKDPNVWVAWRIAKAGLNPIEAFVVQANESGYHDNDNVIGYNNGSVDLGRWQWNSQHVESGFISLACTGDYKCATEKAIEARLRDGSWAVKWYGARKAGIK